MGFWRGSYHSYDTMPHRPLLSHGNESLVVLRLVASRAAHIPLRVGSSWGWLCGGSGCLQISTGLPNKALQRTRQTAAAPLSFHVPRDCVARNRGADFVQCLAPPRSARRNKALDPTARVGCPQASLLPSAVLAGQRRD